MIRRIPINAVQAAIYSILSTKQTTPVYDSTPFNTSPPYILISDYEYEIDGAKNVDITEITFELEIWTTYKGKAKVNEIIEDVVAVLTAWPLELSAAGFKVMSQDAKGGRGMRSEDGGNFYGTVNFAIRIQNIGG